MIEKGEPAKEPNQKWPVKLLTKKLSTKQRLENIPPGELDSPLQPSTVCRSLTINIRWGVAIREGALKLQRKTLARKGGSKCNPCKNPNW